MSYQDSEDAELQRAIALSLQETAAKQQPEYIVIDDDDDDQDAAFQTQLQCAIEASKQVAGPSSNAASTEPSRAASATSFLSERAQLEQERLARQKRLRPDIDNLPRDAGDEDDKGDTRGAKRQRISSSSSVRTHNANTTVSRDASRAPATNSARSGGAEIFWAGELRQTANMHVDAAKDTRPVFRLTDILSPRDDIEFAIISSYCTNFPWIYSFFNPATPVIAVAHDPAGQETIKAILPNWIKTTPFLRNGYGCMHMKFMLLFHKTGRLRIVVSTANLIEYDWRDIENSVWVQDVPIRSKPIAHDPKAEDFPAKMIAVLRGVNVAPALISLLRNDHPDLPLKRLEDLRTQWDFSMVKAQLVPSLAGKHEGWQKVVLSGHTALMKAVRDIGAQTPKGKEVMLECQGSSIGTYSTQWMNEFHCSARGDRADWLDVSKARRAKLPYPPIKILFPSAQTVRASVLGEPGGGTMFCRRAQWEAAKFPRQLFCDSKSRRGRVLMHTKMILAVFHDKPALSWSGSAQEQSETESETEDEDDSSDAGALAGWVYVGSHNFTPSAWGTLSGSVFNPSLNVTNYELGVVLPLKNERDADRVASWERPPRKYVLGTDEPWIQEESDHFKQ